MGVCKHTVISITPILSFPLAGGRNALFTLLIGTSLKSHVDFKFHRARSIKSAKTHPASAALAFGCIVNNSQGPIPLTKGNWQRSSSLPALISSVLVLQRRREIADGSYSPSTRLETKACIVLCGNVRIKFAYKNLNAYYLHVKVTRAARHSTLNSMAMSKKIRDSTICKTWKAAILSFAFATAKRLNATPCQVSIKTASLMSAILYCANLSSIAPEETA